MENINQKIAECETRQKELQKENQGEQRKMNDYLQNNEKRDAIIVKVLVLLEVNASAL